MTAAAAIRSTPLDDFLAESGSSTETGELLQRIGLVGSLLGITLAIGLVVFLTVVHTGRRQEIVILIRFVTAAGALTILGAVLELAGVASIDDLSWSEALTDSAGSAPMMRLLAGLLILLGLFEQSVPVDDPQQTDEPDQAIDAASIETASVDDDAVSRWVPTSASAFAIVGLAVGAMSFWFDGHTVTEGPRVVHAVVNLVHVTAGGVWFGGLVGLVIVGLLRRGTGSSMAPQLVRFSSVATVALIGVVLAGSLMTLMIIDGPGDLTSTDWGRLLLVKAGAVAIVAGIGGYHHFAVIPALEREDSTPERAARARVSVAIEALLLLCVVLLTVFLSTASTN